MIKTKERILATRQVNISANSVSYVNISSLVVPNGGVLIVTLYKANDSFVTDYKSLGVATSPSTATASATQVNGWLQDAGETLVFVQPSKTLAVQVVTDKDSYSAGETVTYTAQVVDTVTGQPVQGAFVSLRGVDDPLAAHGLKVKGSASASIAS